MEKISDKEKSYRKHKKELNSLRNKMGSNIVWFDSLTLKRQYDILFMWKRVKRGNTRTKPEYVKVRKKVPVDPTRPWGRKKIVEELKLVYPPSLKHFIIECKRKRVFQPEVTRVRENAIDLILNKK